jgi:hypothetical protein
MSQTEATSTAGSRKSGCQPPVQRLKSERVQEQLAAMGWVAGAGVHTFVRSVRFTTPRVAGAYAAYVKALADQAGQRVKLQVTGRQVLVTLLGRAVTGRQSAWTKAVLDVAKRLAA